MGDRWVDESAAIEANLLEKENREAENENAERLGCVCSRMSAALVHSTCALHLMQHLCAALASSAAGFVYRASQDRFIRTQTKNGLFLCRVL